MDFWDQFTSFDHDRGPCYVFHEFYDVEDPATDDILSCFKWMKENKPIPNSTPGLGPNVSSTLPGHDRYYELHLIAFLFHYLASWMPYLTFLFVAGCIAKVQYDEHRRRIRPPDWTYRVFAACDLARSWYNYYIRCATPTQETTLQGLMKNLTHRILSKPMRTTLRLGPILWLFKRASSKRSKPELAIAVSQLISFIVDDIPGDDVTLLNDMKDLILSQTNKIQIIFLRMFKRKNDEAQFQSDSDVKNAVKMAAFIISVLGGTSTATEKSFRKFSDVINLATKNLKSLDDVFNQFQRYFSGSAEEDELREMISEIHSHIVDFRGSAFAEKLDRFEDITELNNKAINISRIAEKHPDLKHSVLLRDLTRQMQLLSDLQVNLKLAMDFRASIRPHPVNRNWIGLPGCGKTTFIRETLIPDLMRKMEDDTPAAETIYSTDPSSQHMAGYVKQKFFIIDEFLAKQHEDPILANYNALSTDEATTINGAALEFKNMRPLHEFLFTISNTNKLHSNSNQTSIEGWVTALNSRLNNIYVHWPEYDTSKGRTEQEGERALCLHKVDTNYVIPKNHAECPNSKKSRTIEEREQAYREIKEEIYREWCHYQSRYAQRLDDYDAAREAADRRRENRNVTDEGKHESAGAPFYVRAPEDKHARIADIIEESVPGYYNTASSPIGRQFCIVNLTETIQPNVEVLNYPADDNTARFLKELEEMDIRPVDYALPDHTGAMIPFQIAAKNGDEMIGFLGKYWKLTTEEKRYCNLMYSSKNASSQMIFIELCYRIFPHIRMFHFTHSDVLVCQVNGSYSLCFNANGSNIIGILGRSRTCQGQFVSDIFYRRADIGTKTERVHSRTSMLVNTTIECLAAFVYTFLAYRLATNVYNFFKPQGEEEEEEKEPEYDVAPQEDRAKPAEIPTNIDPKVLATLLTKYEVDPEKGLVHHEKGYIYDAEARNWKRIDKLSAKRLDQLYKARAKYQEDRYYQSLDAGLLPRRNRKGRNPLGEFESEMMNPLDDILFGPAPQGSPKNQYLLNEIIRAQHTDRATLDQTCHTLSKARVTVMSDNCSQFGICMTKNYILTNSHLSESNSFDVYSKGKWYNARCHYRDPRSDILVIKVTDSSWPPAKDITSLLVDANNLQLEVSGGLVLPGENHYGVHYGHLEWDLHGLNGSCRTFTNNIVKIHWPSKMTVTKQGLCGSPLVLNSPKRNVAIFAGIHSFAVERTNVAGCAIMTRQLWDDIMTLHEMKTTALAPVRLNGELVSTEVADIFSSPNPRAKNPIEKNDRLFFLGHFDRAVVQQVNKTEFSPVPAPINNPTKNVPAIMPSRELTKEAVEKLQKNPFGRPSRAMTQLKKMEITEKKMTEHNKLKVIEGMTQHYFDLLLQGEVRPLKKHEVVNGVAAGVLQEVKGLDMSKSAGFTLKKLFGVKSKGELFEFDGIYTPKDTPATRYLYSYIEGLEKGTTPVLLWPSTASLKDEQLPREKVEKDGKIRLFSSNDIMQLFADKMYFGWVMGFAHNHLHETHATVGINPLVDFDQLYRDLKKKGYLFTGDYSSWDKTLPLDVMEAACQVLRNVVAQHYTPEEYRVADQILEAQCKRFEVLEGGLYYIKGSMSSGVWMTNFLNSLCNVIIRLWCIMEEFEAQGKPVPDVQEIFSHCVLRDHGDDEINAVDDEYAEIIHYFSMKKHKERLGLRVTPATKDGIEQKYEMVEETSFLSRFPRDFGARTCGALKKSSIEKQLEFQRNMTVEERRDLFESILGEAAMWDEEYFNHIRACIVTNMKLMHMDISGLPTYKSTIAFLKQQIGESRQVPSKDGGAGEAHFEMLRLDDENTQVSRFAATGEAKNQNNKSINTNKEANKDQLVDETMKILLNCEDHEYSVPLTAKALQKCTCKKRRTVFEPMSYNLTEIMDAIQYLDINVTRHVKSTLDHKEEVCDTGKDFYGSEFPDHDNSKFSDAERVAYELKHTHGVLGDLWNFAQWHHYLWNEHHPLHFRLETWENFSKGQKFTDFDPMSWEDSLLEEIVCDAVACLGRSAPILTRRERLQRVLKIYDGSEETTRLFPPSIYPCLVQTIGRVRDPSLPMKVETWKCGNLEFTSFSSYVNYLRNSKQQGLCPECDSKLPYHSPLCRGSMTLKCNYCALTNDDGKKMKNHIMNSHPNMSIHWSLVPLEHQSAKGSGPNIAEAPAMAKVPEISSSGVHGYETLALAGTVPAAANILPGYLADLESLARTFVEISYFSVPSISPRGTTLIVLGYAELESMCPAGRLMAHYHEYFHGDIELEFTVFGAGNKIGSMLVGAVPNVNSAPFDISTIQSYGNWKSLAMNTQATCTMTLRNADTVFRPRRVVSRDDTTSFRPGIVAMIEEPVQNALSTDETQISVQIKARLAPDAGFTYPKLDLINADASAFSSQVFQAPTSINVKEITGVSSGMLHLDGEYFVPSRLGANTAYVGPLSDGKLFEDDLQFCFGRTSFIEQGQSVPNQPGCNGTSSVCIASYDDGSGVGKVYNNMCWRTGYTHYENINHRQLQRDKVTGSYAADYMDYYANTTSYSVGVANYQVNFDCKFNFSAGSGCSHINASSLQGGGAEYAWDIYLQQLVYEALNDNRDISAFVVVGQAPRKGLRPNLKRFTLGATRPTFSVSSSVPAYPVVGETYEELALREWLVANHGPGNLLFNLTVANYPVAEVLYDADNRCFWINNTSKYGYLDVNFEEVVITNVTNVTTSTNPRRSETKFVSLVRSGNPAKGVHQASAAVAAAGIAGGASLLGNLGSNLTTGIGSKKNRELVREQAELNRLFMADQAQRGRAYGLVATKFGNVMDQEFAKYKASLVADTSKDLAQTSVAMQRNMIGITNANLETTIDPGRMNQQYASPSPTSYKEEDKKTGEDQSNKNQSFVEAGAPIEGVGRDILIGSIGGSTGVQVGPNPGVGAPGAPKSFTLPPHEKMPDAPMPTGPRNPDGKMYKAVQPPSEMDAGKQATKDQLPSEAIPKSQVTSGSQEITTTAEVHAPPATKENTVFLGSDGGKNQVSTA